MPRAAIALILLTTALLGPAAGAEGPDYQGLRRDMVRLVEINVAITGEDTGIKELSPRVLAVMREVPRHLFVPEALRPYAYSDHPLPLGHGQNLASPFVVALMTHLAELEPDDVVFETGTGAGYHAAVLAKLAAQVYSVEVVEPLAGLAAATLTRLGVVNAHARSGDGYYGWPDHAPYDAILVKEALDHVPVPLLNQLKAGGRMVLPLGSLEGGQYLTVVRKQADGTTRRTRILPVLFSPLQGGERT
ncbi:MAG: protein-L-isoaspartate(D-aspartate) O-methyltransferase [Rhodospirillales bacterium]|nr:protein-L-isoaspartate(D-aspartate) O-methyltransferase [Rhodospirillales bacterium]MDH3791369.1 protein-L-isoaspartate(D-aspartate) O-methyltransferase [Rhodospirillales bacterium]MDH3909807.1 protein-L-isoaspartate(D-aspartate) O-methyltransferase [Rhodospirillales bacterium]MDH3968685.1 protein-L-isoaspartate(D-aspartate) O-methyltransferase [Rhodospirillales bacterium]